MSELRTILSIDEFLNRCRVALVNGRDTPEIQSSLAVFGYDVARLDVGLGLLETAEQLHAGQKKQYGEQHAATSAVEQARTKADEAYTMHRKLAQLALKKSPEQQNSLGLNETKKESLSGWLGQGLIFYRNILGDPVAIAALGRFNIDEAALLEGQALIQGVADQNATQEKEKYEAQQATKDRDAALDALDEFMVDYREVAKIALADKPQQLEALQFAVVA